MDTLDSRTPRVILVHCQDDIELLAPFCSKTDPSSSEGGGGGAAAAAAAAAAEAEERDGRGGSESPRRGFGGYLNPMNWGSGRSGRGGRSRSPPRDRTADAADGAGGGNSQGSGRGSGSGRLPTLGGRGAAADVAGGGGVHTEYQDDTSAAAATGSSLPSGMPSGMPPDGVPSDSAPARTRILRDRLLAEGYEVDAVMRALIDHRGDEQHVRLALEGLGRLGGVGGGTTPPADVSAGALTPLSLLSPLPPPPSYGRSLSSMAPPKLSREMSSLGRALLEDALIGDAFFDILEHRDEERGGERGGGERGGPTHTNTASDGGGGGGGLGGLDSPHSPGGFTKIEIGDMIDVREADTQRWHAAFVVNMARDEGEGSTWVKVEHDSGVVVEWVKLGMQRIAQFGKASIPRMQHS